MRDESAEARGEPSGDEVIIEEGRRNTSQVERESAARRADPKDRAEPKERDADTETIRSSALAAFFHGNDTWSPGLPELDWNEPIHALRTLQRYLVSQTQGDIEYYLRRKRTAKRWTYFFRGMAVLLGSAATLTPAIIGLLSNVEDIARWAPLSTILAALAAAMLGIDRFFGFSSGWMRFVWTAIDLENRLDDFEMDWAAIEYELSRGPIDQDTILKHLQWMKAFRHAIDGRIKRETGQWIKEFRGRVEEENRTIRPLPSTPLSTQGAPATVAGETTPKG